MSKRAAPDGLIRIHVVTVEMVQSAPRGTAVGLQAVETTTLNSRAESSHAPHGFAPVKGVIDRMACRLDTSTADWLFPLDQA